MKGTITHGTQLESLRQLKIWIHNASNKNDTTQTLITIARRSDCDRAAYQLEVYIQPSVTVCNHKFKCHRLEFMLTKWIDQLIKP